MDIMKELLLLQAIELVRNFPLNKVSTERLAFVTGVPVKVVSHHFLDKEHMIADLLRKVICDLEQKAYLYHACAKDAIHEMILHCDSLREIVSLNELFQEDNLTNFPKALVLIQNFKANSLQEIIKANIDNGIRCGLYIPELQSRTISRVCIMLIEIFALRSDVDPDHLFKVLHLFLRGIVSVCGKELYSSYRNPNRHSLAGYSLV